MVCALSSRVGAADAYPEAAAALALAQAQAPTAPATTADQSATAALALALVAIQPAAVEKSCPCCEKAKPKPPAGRCGAASCPTACGADCPCSATNGLAPAYPAPPGDGWQWNGHCWSRLVPTPAYPVLAQSPACVGGVCYPAPAPVTYSAAPLSLPFAQFQGGCANGSCGVATPGFFAGGFGGMSGGCAGGSCGGGSGRRR